MTRRKADNPAADRITFSNRERAAIRSFLKLKLEQAGISYARCRQAAKIDPTGSMAANAMYWRNVCGGLKWALSHCQHLANKD